MKTQMENIRNNADIPELSEIEFGVLQNVFIKNPHLETKVK